MTIFDKVDQLSGHAPESAEEARQQVVAVCRILARFGQEDLTLGHVSVRGPVANEIYIKAKGKALGDVTPNDVMMLNLNDPDCHLALGAHLEAVMHTEAYRARPEVGAAIHTHALYATALGATTTPLAFLSHDAALFSDGVGLFDATVGMVTTIVDGLAVAKALGGRRAVLLRNHGMFAVGEDIRWAVLAAVTLERAVRVQTIASSLGNFVPIPDHQLKGINQEKYRDGFLDEYWESWIRSLATPEYHE
ncbi:MAG TPA: class II aldolase/adducin family protein [Acidimicrobiales bacterium]|nr:class II aldolase/adducin family protein [Acidimicrobiales bacterium]